MPQLEAPFVTRVTLPAERIRSGEFPFEIPLFSREFALTISRAISFFVGENGTGKSTLIEALAWAAGFDQRGGGREHQRAAKADDRPHPLGRALVVSWRRRATRGFFLRAETFFDFATYLENVGSTFQAYGGRSLHAQSHGEAFLSLFQHRFDEGLFLLDEPEAALSPQRQLAFLAIVERLARAGKAQFLIATHSPILLALPGATILSLDSGALREIAYRDTEPYRITRAFIEAPERTFDELFRGEDGD